MPMKTILCYGNSLTWGYSAEGPSRHALADRWPSVLQAALGSGVHVVAEGLNGRTTAFDDHLAGADRNGARLLPTILTSHAPLDLIIIMLGANDMKPWIHGNAVAAKQGMQRLIDIVRGHDYPLAEPAPQILIVVAAGGEPHRECRVQDHVRRRRRGLEAACAALFGTRRRGRLRLFRRRHGG